MQPLRRHRACLSELVVWLDTDHLTVFASPESAQYESLSATIRESPEDFGTTIVSSATG